MYQLRLMAMPLKFLARMVIISQFHQNIKADFKDNVISFDRIDDSSVSRSMHGTTRQIISNMIVASVGFKKELEIVGVGYQASVQGKRLKLQLGFFMIYFCGFSRWNVNIEA